MLDYARPPLVRLDVDENGRYAHEHGEVWTGSETGGIATGGDCEGWTSGFDRTTATAGSTLETNARWTEGTTRRGCGESLRLYCLEQ